MFDRIGSSAVMGLGLALGYTVVGCGATGLAWVDQPETASGWSESEQRGLADHPRPPAPGSGPVIAAVTDAEPASENHQRLNHTVTLGEVDATEPAAQVAPGYGPSLSVTINNYGQSGAAPPYAGYAGYAGYYSGFAGVARGGNFARSGAVTGASRSSGSMQPGQNWPAVSDHGTSFPYRSAPASPWR